MRTSWALLLVFLVASAFYLLGTFEGKADLDSGVVAEKFEACDESFSRKACLKELAEELLDESSVPGISLALNSLTNDDSIRDCHLFAHYIGNSLYKESSSMHQALGECEEFCFGGCYHGVAEEKFGQSLSQTGILEEDFLNDLQEFDIYCSGFEVSEDRSKCYLEFSNAMHGLGHAFMFVTSNELPQSLGLCDVAGRPFGMAESCYDGVFMSNSDALNDPNHPSKYIRQGDIIFPCDVVAEQHKAFCYKGKADFFLNDMPDKNIENCKLFPQEFQEYCFEQAARVISNKSFEPEGLVNGCSLVPEEHFSSCVRGLMVLITGKFPKTSEVALSFCEYYEGDERIVCLNHFGEQIESRGWGSQFVKETCPIINKPKPAWCSS